MQDYDSVEAFLDSDQIQLMKKAQPIIEKLQTFIPYKLNWSNIQYGYLRLNTHRTIAQITYSNPPVIRLNQAMLAPGMEAQTYKELVHELAHLGAYLWKGETGHNYHWGYLMIAMGYEPARCINSEESTRINKARRILKRGETIFEDCPKCKKATFFEAKEDQQYHCQECDTVIK